jgi:hypothetical protein
MASWVYVFSRFTPEALLFEALIISLLCASYAAFWVLRKRKLGVLRNMGAEAPAGVVKAVLTELIFDAEQLHAQLFGLIAGHEATAAGATYRSHAMIRPLTGAPSPSAAALAADPDVMNKIAALEAKMIEQTKATEAVLADKTRLEKELAALKAGHPGAAAGGETGKLQEKMQILEAKLAEYSVIEDDLANLKRLQQENAQLKAQLGGKTPAAGATAAGSAKNAATAAPAAAIEEVAAPAIAEVSPFDALASAETPTEISEVPQEAASATPLDEVPTEAAAQPAAAIEEIAQPMSIAEPTTPESIANATADPNFEGLVDQVEQSLAEPVAASATAPSGATTGIEEVPVAAAASAAGAGKSAKTQTPAEKSDADLVAEFEKMLNS